MKKNKNLLTVLHIIIISSLILLTTDGCGKEKIFTNIDYSFNSIDDIFPTTFEKVKGEFVENRVKSLEGIAKQKIAVYGNLASLAVFECESKAHCKSNWEKLVKGVKETNLKSYSQTKSGELRFDYKSKDAISGILWTKNGFLFTLEAKTYELLGKFIVAAKLGKLQ